MPPAIGSVLSVHAPALPQAHREIQSAVICGVLPSILPVLLQSFEADVFLWYLKSSCLDFVGVYTEV